MTQVAIRHCEDYQGDIKNYISQLFNDLGGIGNIVPPRSRVLLKPNLVFNSKPEKAATTHPSIIAALTTILVDHGCEVWVGDSPFIGSTKRWFDKTDVAKAGLKAGAKIARFKKTIQRGCASAKIVPSFPVTADLEKVDYIINLPKLKTHKQMVFTGAVKNNYGLIVGPTKGALHMKMQTKERFAHMLIDLLLSTRPNLHLMDGIIGMEGNGPGSGAPIRLGMLAMSEDALCLDYVACQLAGIPLDTVPVHLAALTRKDLEYQPELIETIGDQIDPRRFKPADELLINFMPKFMSRFAKMFPELKVES